jgi:hypothetical protein
MGMIECFLCFGGSKRPNLVQNDIIDHLIPQSAAKLVRVHYPVGYFR